MLQQSYAKLYALSVSFSLSWFAVFKSAILFRLDLQVTEVDSVIEKIVASETGFSASSHSCPVVRLSSNYCSSTIEVRQPSKFANYQWLSTVRSTTQHDTERHRFASFSRKTVLIMFS